MKDKKRTKPKQIAVFFRIDAEAAGRLKSRAKAQYLTFSALCRKIVDKWLENNPLNFPPQP